jgi:hypothetical protein
MSQISKKLQQTAKTWEMQPKKLQKAASSGRIPSGPPLTLSFGFLSLSLSLRFRGLPSTPTKKPTRQKTSHRRPRRAQSLRQNSFRFLKQNAAKQVGKSRPIGFLQPTGHNTARKEIPCVWHGPGRSPRVGRPA